MAEKMFHGRDHIRREIREDFEYFEDKGGYRAVAELWGISTGTAWRMINERYYWPSDPEVKEQIRKAGLKRGIAVGIKPLPDVFPYFGKEQMEAQNE